MPIALPLLDLVTHECVICKERHKANREHSYSRDKVRRITCLAGKEAKSYSNMTIKAIKDKAARLSAADVELAIDNAIAEAALDRDGTPPASAVDLAAIALLCGADDGQATAILDSEASASADNEQP